MGNYGGVTFAKQPKKGGPRDQESRTPAKTSPRNPYTNPAKGSQGRGTVNEKL